MQFYEPSDGVIAVDNHNLQGYSKSSYMSQIAVVFQDGGILNGSILDNIRYGRTSDSEPETRLDLAIRTRRTKSARRPPSWRNAARSSTRSRTATTQLSASTRQST
ncbi:hypothetical protein DYB32_005479 [Aphanomyces invadans]|uniref:ABC transporter domain-containing protein n=1 Tax=Aphanomyces invadans TaxID=157072 RepID=A0A418AX28_9STRA|nr:hypothetical protein DYB32_005479 [Aphanomyces invadans]